MGFFKGNIGNSYTENHVFIILDKSFQDNGVGSLTKSGYDEFVQTDFGKSVLKARMDASGATNSSYYENIIQLFGLGSGSCKIWDGSDYVTKSFSEGELLELIDYHESGKAKKPEEKDEAKDTLITQINSSIQGCVVFKKSGQAILKCYFYSHNTRQNDRVVTQKGSPLITATPRKPSGAKYGHRYTQEKLQEDTSDAHNIGVFIGASSDGDNDVNNTVTAPVAYSLDASRGMWTIANQMIVRLATDVDSANIVGFDLTDDLELTTSATWYKSDGEKNASQRATGKAVPMSVQNNNPNTFGPNIKLCDGTKKVEQIPVVNRSNDSFKKGDVAIASLMDGEWILQKFGTLETKPQPTSIGRWGFTKLIANSDWFFRNRVNNNQLLPASCQELLKNKFFKTLAQADSNLPADMVTKAEISALNMVGDYFPIELNYYLQTSSFDHTKAEMGGTAPISYYKNINMEYPASQLADMQSFTTTPAYWGPVFPDGYSSIGHARMRTKEGIFTTYKISSKSIEMDSHNDWYFGTGFEIAPIANADLVDSNFMQLPADIATNGRYDGDGFPLEDTADIIRSINSDNFASAINRKIIDGYSYYLGDSDKNPVYGIKPNNPLKLQFTPLSAELAGADDVNASNLTSRYDMDRNFRRNIKGLLANVGINIDINFDQSLFGNLYKRLKTMALGSLVEVEPTTCDGVYSDALVGSFDCIPYDCYIKLTPLDKGISSLFPFKNPTNPAKDGANLVGITVARNKFTKNKGGTMNISAKQVFGIFGSYIGGGAGTVTATIIGAIGSWITNNPSVLTGRWTSVWGSTSSDSIQSFGTTALHAMVWDYWPEQQTVFIPQYFTVLHFNPGKLLSSPDTEAVKYKPAGETEITVQVDKTEYDVDFRVPTFEAGFAPVPAGTTFTKDGPKLAPQNMWRVNTVRRGQLVTNNSNGVSDTGFMYYKTVIGLSKQGHSIQKAGSGFSIGDKISPSNGVTIEVKAVDGSGGISDFDFAEDKTYADRVNIKTYKKGEGYSASSFPADGLKLTVNSPSKGAASIIVFTSAEAYKQIKLDAGPKMRCPITRLSSPSGDGTRRIEAIKNTTLNIEDNSSAKYKNQYEAFYFYHNDIGHVFNTPEVEANPNFAQYITITIS